MLLLFRKAVNLKRNVLDLDPDTDLDPNPHQSNYFYGEQKHVHQFWIEGYYYESEI